MDKEDLPLSHNPLIDAWAAIESLPPPEFKISTKFTGVPNITLPLPKFLNYLWEYHFARSNYMSTFSIVDYPLGELIARLDNGRKYCHVEFVKDFTTNPATDVAQIWPLKEWQSAYERKLINESKRKEENEAKERGAELVERIVSATGRVEPWSCMETAQSSALVRMLLRKKDWRRLEFMLEETSVTINKEEKIIV